MTQSSFSCDTGFQGYQMKYATVKNSPSPTPKLKKLPSRIPGLISPPLLPLGRISTSTDLPFVVKEEVPRKKGSINIR